jgi:hypothetical protein
MLYGMIDQYFLLLSRKLSKLVLEAIANLLENPNPDDALMASVAEIYNTNKTKFIKTAKEYVKKVSLSSVQVVDLPSP